jgi:gas vesicle protein
MTNQTNGGLAILGATMGFFVLGGAAGYMAGLLSAPASGQETRRRLGRTLEDGRHMVVRRGQRAVNRAMDHVQSGIEQGRKKLNHTLVA